MLVFTEPLALSVEARVLDAGPGTILVDRSPFFPGGGGQLADRGRIQHRGGAARFAGAHAAEGGVWLALDGPEPRGDATVLLEVDPAFRALMCELHTAAHIANSVVFQAFGGALLTGAQLAEDGTFRVDFDLPGVENDRLRATQDAMNAAIRADHPVRAVSMPYDEAAATPGLFRSKSVAPPPQPDGRVRIVEIGTLDRQACGGTHLASTGLSRTLRILKVDNKGRQNRRLRIGLEGPPAPPAA
ncbi:MAG: alanyl-tRNA editing protein [Alsobacter sp.]